MDIWTVVFSERKALAADLKSLDENQWATTSWCTDWTVRDMVAHITATAKIPPTTFFPKMLGSGFSLPRLQNKDISVERGASTADTLARFEAVEKSVKRPPGPAASQLTGEGVATLQARP